MNLIYYQSSQNTTFGFSSVPGPPDGFCFHGMKSKGMYAFYPPICEQLCNSLAVMMDDNLRLSIQLDSNYVKKPDLFIAIFEKRMREFLEERSEQSAAKDIISSKD